MDYDMRSATFYRNKASLATVDGRVELPFVLPSDSPTPYERYVLSEDYEFRESTLRYDAVTDWRKQYIHTVANELVSEAVEHDCDVIVFEELDGIRERLPHAKWHHVWAFRRLSEYVEYKAPERGVSVEQVASNHTSQRCSRTDCGFTHERNRDGEHFECQKAATR